MSKLFRNTGSLAFFTLKRERIKLPLWIIFICAFLVLLVPVYDDLIKTTSNIKSLVDTMKNPAMIAIVGPVFEKKEFTLGSIYANYMLLYSIVMIAIYNIFLISANTRKDEEDGRLELLKSLPLGRLSSISSISIILVLSNLIVAIITCIGLYYISPKLAFLGCLNFSLAIFVSGVLFGAISIFFSQICVNNRSAMGFSFLILLALYFMRAIGDLSNETLSLISPLGLILRTENFVNNYFWPIAIIVLEILVILCISFIIALKRDIGTGLIPQFKGKKHAVYILRGIRTFSIKLTYKTLVLWVALIFSLAAIYGSVFGDMESYINSSDMMKAMFYGAGSGKLVEQFISMFMYIMSIIACIPVLVIINRTIYEEKSKRIDEILTKAVSRNQYLNSYLWICILAIILFQLQISVVFWAVGKQYLGSIPDLDVFLKASLLFVPANFLMLGINVFLIGALPKFAKLNYIYLTYSFFVMYLGKLLDLDNIFKSIVPYGYVVQYPIEKIDLWPSIVMVLVGYLLIKLGYIAYNMRDIQ